MSKKRELWLTPEVQKALTNPWDLQYVALGKDIPRIMSGETGECNVIRLHAAPYLSTVLPPEVGSDAERVVFWHGPTDGAFWREKTFSRATKRSFDIT